MRACYWKQTARILTWNTLKIISLTKGSAGAKKAIATLHQVEQQPNTVTVKWDGSPAVIFGRNEKGEFILTDKSGFTAKGYDGKVTSADDLEGMLTKTAVVYESN